MNPRNPLLMEMLKRIADYTEHDIVAAREKLVALWRAAHPEAATEPPSAKHRPLDKLAEGNPKDPKRNPEHWANDIYDVNVRRYDKDPVFGTDGGMIQIGISAHDGTARHDWREMQWIKNQIAGEECEAFELFPAESRLLDPSNYYTLWCFPGVKQLKIGVTEGRRVWEPGEAWAPQRGFSK